LIIVAALELRDGREVNVREGVDEVFAVADKVNAIRKASGISVVLSSKKEIGSDSRTSGGKKP